MSTADVDGKSMFEKLPERIRSDFDVHNRLEGNHRLASEGVLDRVLMGQSISRRWLGETFGIDANEVVFVVNYVVVRVRLAIEKLSVEIRNYRVVEDWRDFLGMYSPIVVE